jgi:hypothetical protein
MDDPDMYLYYNIDSLLVVSFVHTHIAHLDSSHADPRYNNIDSLLLVVSFVHIHCAYGFQTCRLVVCAYTISFATHSLTRSCSNVSHVLERDTNFGFTE